MNRLRCLDQIYLFGSILDSDSICNDVDVLVVYQKYSCEVRDAIRFLIIELERNIELPIDLTVLSWAELGQVAFFDKIAPSYLRIK